MVKAYFNFEYQDAYGLVSSQHSNVTYWEQEHSIVTGSNQYIVMINRKSGEIYCKLSKVEKHQEVTYVQISNRDFPQILAGGYQDGDILLWDLSDNKSLRTSLNGHKSAITAIKFSFDDALLFSGSADSKIIVWDIIAEQPLYKLRGHKNAITCLDYFQHENNSITENLLLSSSKDGLFKVIHETLFDFQFIIRKNFQFEKFKRFFLNKRNQNK